MMSVIILFLSAFSVFTFILWCYFYINRNREFYKNIPGPPGLPLLGNVLQLRNTTELLDNFLKYINDYGGLVRINVGPVRKFLIVTDYKLLEFLLSTNNVLTKSKEYKHFHSWLGTGLLTSTGVKWKKHRKIITPTFHFKILELFIDIFENCGDILVQKLSKNQCKSLDIYPYLSLCTLDIICESAMGTSTKAQTNTNSDYVRSVKEMGRIIMARSTSLLGGNDWTHCLTRDYYKQKKAINILHNFTNNVIMQRQNELLKNRENDQFIDNNNFSGCEKIRKVFLDHLLDTQIDGKQLTLEDIREEVDTFMFEGHDTTATAISFAIYNLANHVEIQNRVLEEQFHIFDGNFNNCLITITVLQRMKYLEQVIKESLRLYPSIPIFARETDKDIKFGDLLIPKGVTLSIFPYGMHRKSEYFPNPNIFNPDRFEEINGKFPYAFIPFSAGSRNCIGQKFAMLEMKSIISKIVRHFQLIPAEPHHNLILTPESVLKSINGVRIGLYRRYL